MYRIVVQLKQCDTYGHEYHQTIHEVLYPEYSSIQKAFEAIDTGKDLFKVYSEIDKEVKKDISRFAGKMKC